MNQERFSAAMAAFDEANRQDPNREMVEGEPYPREWLYAQWLTEWVDRLRPDASEELRLAARCQHIERWKTPRSTFPPGREGYLEWRKFLARYHAQRAGEILKEAGYPEPTIRRVQELNLKQNIKGDPETQTLEDALCLVFLEKQLHEFVLKTEEATMIRILRRSWKKMSTQARQIALRLPLQPGDRKLLEKALSE